MANDYLDMPVLPDSKWRVHDADRPAPPVVVPPTFSTQDRPGRQPSDAVALFDGSNLDAWSGRDGAAAWALVDGDAMDVRPGAGDIRTRRTFGSCQLHVEWRAPAAIRGDGQGRGNSGVFLLGLYEIQVLDSHDNPTYADGQAAALYGQYPPLVNACVPPGHWHVYDVIFEAPTYREDVLTSPAYMTVFHNGLLAHHRQRLQGPTLHGELASYDPPHATDGPLVLQDHGDPVRFRNIWARPLRTFSAV